MAKQQERKPTTTSEEIDRERARRALEKRRQGKEPTREELAALRRIEKAREEEQRWSFYRSIPQKHWREMSGRQPKILREQAQAYGIPFDGATVDLPTVVKALHDFLAKNGRKLLADTDDPMLAVGNSPALEEYRRERAKLARLDRLEREEVLLPREKVHEGLTRIAAILRSAGETLQRSFGSEPYQVLMEALDDARREIDRLFSGGGDADIHGPGPASDAE
jgi:hypothetical protein